MSSTSHVNSHRRIFRGRGKNKDGNLIQRPHRRIQKSKDEYQKPNKYAAEDDSSLTKHEHDINHKDEINQKINQKINHKDEILNDTEKIENEIETKAKKEMKQLSKRIFHIRESIQLSSDAIMNPTTWEQNVLNAVSNCCHTWQSILRYYFYPTNDNSNDESNNENNDNHILHNVDTFASIQLQKTIKEIALDLYGLVQMAMQTGPLVGSSPGYFKRCGSIVANMALVFLQSLPISTSSIQYEYNDTKTNQVDKHKLALDSNSFINLGFSIKQMTAISKWYTNAEKCVKANLQPSKSMQKKQTQKKSKKKKGL